MRNFFVLVILLLFIVPLFSADYRIEQQTQEGFVRTLGKIYRHADNNTLLALCTPRGRRYFTLYLRRFGLANWKRRMRDIGRRIIRGDISGIHILPDGSVRLSIIFYLRYKRRAVPYRDSIVITKLRGNYWISGK